MFLLDKTILGELRKQRCDVGVRAWAAATPADAMYVSVLVVGELHRGVESLGRRDPETAGTLRAWLSGLTTHFEDHLVPVTLDVALEWGRLRARSAVPAVDGLLAATALVHEWSLGTRNVVDVQATGVHVVNPFSADVDDV